MTKKPRKRRVYRITLTTEDIAKLLGITEQAMYKKISREKLKLTEEIDGFWTLVELLEKEDRLKRDR